MLNTFIKSRNAKLKKVFGIKKNLSSLTATSKFNMNISNAQNKDNNYKNQI